MSNTTTTTTSDAIQQVYIVVEFSDFEYCQAGCWLSIVIGFGFVGFVVLRPVLKRILPLFWLKEESSGSSSSSSCTLTWACLVVLLELLSDLLEILYAILGISKFFNANASTSSNNYQHWWLILSSIGFGLGGLLESFGIADAFCKKTAFDRICSGRIPRIICCCWFFFVPSPQDDVRSRLERFPRLSDNMKWEWFHRGVWMEILFLYPCFGLLSTIALTGGYWCWIVYPIFTFGISAVLVKVDPNLGQGATAFLLPRTLEAIVLTTPLLIVEILATKKIGFVTGALLIRDALEIVWTIVDFCGPSSPSCGGCCCQLLPRHHNPPTTSPEEQPLPERTTTQAATTTREKLQQLMINVPTGRAAMGSIVAMSSVSRSPTIRTTTTTTTTTTIDQSLTN